MSSGEKPGLYVHVPFCRSKCLYCDFYSISALELAPRWINALYNEIAFYGAERTAFDSLYLGGGTPSVLDERTLTELFDFLFEHFRFSEGAEITVEVNPDDLNTEKLGLLKRLGANRISLGAQSLRDEDLRMLGRRHTAEQAGKAIEMIRGCGFSNLSVDLMYGLPNQSVSQWESMLRRAVELGPEHLSCYQLTFYEGTPLGRMLSEGEVESPAEEAQRLFFLKTAEVLTEAGYLHYEISNFARGEERVARHNRKYWRRVEVLGLGPGAHSFWGGTRWWNVSSVAAYCDRLGSGRLPVEESENLTEEQQRIESLSLGLRTREGVSLPFLRTLPGSEKVLSRLESEKLVEVRQGRVVPTTEGYVVADSLPLLFL